VRAAGEASGMNTLTDAQRDRVLALLREGKTLRSIERETGHRRETIAAYGRRAGLIGEDVAELGAARTLPAPRPAAGGSQALLAA
jgi:hypothetical protein